jgi:RNA polymerase sigma factor (TIGR02999 family)
VVYEDLRRMARQQMRRARPGQTLDTAGLVHEAWARLVEESGIDWQDRSHFYAIVARAMRFVVVDRARRRGAQKRGANAAQVELDSGIAAEAPSVELVLGIDQAIARLEAFNARLARIVELRFFAGLTDEEIGAALDVSARTVQRDWLRARAWLQRVLAEAPAGEPGGTG